MRILFVVPRLPYPADRGDRLTCMQVMRELSLRHRVTLLSLVDGHEPPVAIERLGAWCERIVTVPFSTPLAWARAWAALPSATPSQVAYFDVPRLRKRAAELVQTTRFDVILYYSIRLAPVAERLDHPRQVVWLLDSLGLRLARAARCAPWWERPFLAWERWRIDRYTARKSRKFLECWLLSAVDRADLERVGCHGLVLVPHGVDERLFDVTPARAGPARVLFLGNLAVPHNRDAALYAARSVWPLLRRTLPDASLVLAGANPPPEILRLAGRDGIEVPGFVPDLPGLWASASVLLAPIRFSSGIQNKVLEAMAAGVPVVTTPEVADGIAAVPDEHLLVADTPAGLARAVEATELDRAAAAARAQRARRHVRERFSWRAPVERLEALAPIAWTPRGLRLRARPSCALACSPSASRGRRRGAAIAPGSRRDWPRRPSAGRAAADA